MLGLQKQDMFEVTAIEGDTGVITLSKLDDTGQGPFSLSFESYNGEIQFANTYMYWKDAWLALGLVSEVEHKFGDQASTFLHTTGGIPVSVATSGQACIASYMKIAMDDYIRGETRGAIAEKMGVSEQTVSNYWNRVRWDGCTACGSQNVEKVVVDVGFDEVQLVDCNECGEYQVIPEDRRILTTDTPDALETVVTTSPAGDEYILWCNESTGFYTAERDRHFENR